MVRRLSYIQETHDTGSSGGKYSHGHNHNHTHLSGRRCSKKSGEKEIKGKEQKAAPSWSRFLYKENPALDAGFRERYAFDQKSSNS